MNRFSPRWVALWIVALLAVYFCWLMIQPFLEVILWAAVLAIVSAPLNVRLRRRLRRGPSAALTALMSQIVATAEAFKKPAVIPPATATSSK